MKEKVEHIVWHLCRDGLPPESGCYLVSRYGYVYNGEVLEVLPHIVLRYVDTALFLIDLKAWDNNKFDNIYAWAELPEVMHD